MPENNFPKLRPVFDQLMRLSRLAQRQHAIDNSTDPALFDKLHRFEQLREVAGLDWLHLHDLRHVAAGRGFRRESAEPVHQHVAVEREDEVLVAADELVADGLAHIGHRELALLGGELGVEDDAKLLEGYDTCINDATYFTEETLEYPLAAGVQPPEFPPEIENTPVARRRC